MSCTIVHSIFIALLMAMGSCASQAKSLVLEQSSVAQRHHQWMALHGRTYATNEEKERRFNTFRENLDSIQKFNNAKNQTYKLGLNAFADLTKEEFVASHTGFKKYGPLWNSTNNKFRYENVTDIPSSMDWREKGAVTQVKSQGHCGSCWAFSAIAAIEGAIKIKTGNLISLSEQQLVDCARFSDTSGCDGGWMEDAYKYVVSNGGISTETEYKYRAEDRACKVNNMRASSHVVAKITGYEDVPPDNEEALLKAVTMQPVSVCIDSNKFRFYSSGIFSGPCGTTRNHAVTIVGYGVAEDGTKYWQVKNSWGRLWGENGYMRLKREINSPKGLCGIAGQPSYPIV